MKKEQEQTKEIEQATTTQEIAVVEQHEAPAVSNGNGNESLLSVVEFNGGDLPDLAEATAVPVDLIPNYWTPENKGEFKRVFFDTIKDITVLDQQTGELLQLTCAFFYEKVNGQVNTISNGSKRLVGLFEGGQIPRLTPLQITYMGKKKNSTNGFMSDSWSIRPLSLNA